MPLRALSEMNSSEHFAQSYAEARDKFHAAAAGARRAAVSATCIRASAARKARSCRWTLRCSDGRTPPVCCCSSSGTHGVEGFCGSGCQVALLHDDDVLAACGTRRRRVLMLHALNPVRLLAPAPGQRGQRRPESQLRRLPRAAAGQPRLRRAPSAVAAAGIVAAAGGERGAGSVHGSRRMGRGAYQAAVSGGQYEFPDGMFYGGGAPSWSNRVLRAGAASSTPRDGRAWAGSISTPGSGRAATARRSTPARERCRRTSRARARGGATT